MSLTHEPDGAYKVSKADHIIVLDGGKVCEEGSHNELLALEGKYSELVASAAMP